MIIEICENNLRSSYRSRGAKQESELKKLIFRNKISLVLCAGLDMLGKYSFGYYQDD